MIKTIFILNHLLLIIIVSIILKILKIFNNIFRRLFIMKIYLFNLKIYFFINEMKYYYSIKILNLYKAILIFFDIMNKFKQDVKLFK